MTPEGKVKKMVDKYLAKATAWFFKPVSNGLGKHGIPDYICCVPVTVTQDMVGKKVGVFTAIEVKAVGRRREENRGASALQVIVMDDITDRGGFAGVVDSEADMCQLFIGLYSLNSTKNWETKDESPETSSCS